jgi:two-component system, OmpR family, KDP operon response regulator KdpE
MRVLIAEDDKDQLFVRSMLLRQNGFEPIEAADASSAIEKAAVHKPECAVIDLHLPTEELGFGLIRDLKKLDPTIHLILLTGGDARQLSTLSEKALIDEIVVKGSSSTHMIRKLKAIAAEVQVQSR